MHSQHQSGPRNRDAYPKRNDHRRHLHAFSMRIRAANIQRHRDWYGEAPHGVTTRVAETPRAVVQHLHILENPIRSWLFEANLQRVVYNCNERWKADVIESARSLVGLEHKETWWQEFNRVEHPCTIETDYWSLSLISLKVWNEFVSTIIEKLLFIKLVGPDQQYEHYNWYQR